MSTSVINSILIQQWIRIKGRKSNSCYLQILKKSTCQLDDNDSSSEHESKKKKILILKIYSINPLQRKGRPGSPLFNENY